MFDLLPQFNDVIKTFDDPQRLHAAVVHLPIAVAVLGFILTLGVALTGSKMRGLRWITVFIYVLGALAAFWAAQTGEDSEHRLPITPTGVAHEVLEKHQQLAEYFWISLAAAGGLVLLSTVRVTWFRAIALLLAVLVSAGSVGWVAAIGHYGGEMVYRHNVGVPSAGPIAPQDRDTPTPKKDGKDAVKDKEDAKDKADESRKDNVEAPVKDAVKDKAEEKDAGERKLPPINPKDKTIFDR